MRPSELAHLAAIVSTLPPPEPYIAFGWDVRRVIRAAWCIIVGHRTDVDLLEGGRAAYRAGPYNMDVTCTRCRRTARLA